jgi:hypothetical protein
MDDDMEGTVSCSTIVVVSVVCGNPAGTYMTFQKVKNNDIE